jgi:undecaprenyl-diphosphatase
MADLLAALQRLDAAAFLLLNGWHHPLLDAVVPLLSQKEYAVIPAVGLAAVLLRVGGWRAWPLLVAAALAVGLSDLTGGALKGVFERVRPCHVIAEARLLGGCTASFALPSNHALNTGALAAAAWAGSRAAGGALALLAIGVGYSRVYLGVHYPGDVLVGLAVGAGIGWGMGWSALRIRGRLRTALAAAPPGHAADPGDGPGGDPAACGDPDGTRARD